MVEGLGELRARVDGARIAILHYGEHTPLDEGYRPGRMGQLAEWLTESGAMVTRFVPTYSHFSGKQRPLAWSGESTSEGQVCMVPTRAYGNSRGSDRLGFLRDFSEGCGRALRATAEFDLAIVGYPPPGLVSAVRSAGGARLPLLADIRDLWPDALVPRPTPLVRHAAGGLGHLMAQELRKTTGVLAMSNTMLARAPRSKRLGAVPLSVSEAFRHSCSDVDGEAPLQVVFVGSFSSFYDFDAFMTGWSLFLDGRGGGGASPLMRICGAGVLDSEIRAMAERYGSIDMVGWVPSSSVPAYLASADVGIAPTRAGYGTTFGNKVLEYLGAGLHVLNSLEDESATALQVEGFGTRVEPSARGWAAAFATAEHSLDALRAERSGRHDRAMKMYGREGIEPRWLAHIGAALGSAS